MARTVYVLLPAFNEEAAVAPILEKTERVMEERGARYEVVVVDDGSHDGTPDRLEELRDRYPVRVLTHRFNRGLGETIRDGFEFVAEVADPSDVVVRMDCDDTHDPRYIPSMLEKIDDGFEVVIASRYAPGGDEIGLDWYRTSISRIANLLFKAVFPIRGVREYTCGFRAYRVGLVQDALEIFGNKFIDLKGLGFTCTLEKLIKFRMMGARITEVPFTLRYDQKLSSSKVVTSITTLGCFVLMIKHVRYWNEEGRRWKRAIEARRRREYGDLQGSG